MVGRFVSLQFELVFCDLPISVTVLVGEHVFDDAVRVETRGQTTFALVDLTQDVIGELQREKDQWREKDRVRD